MDTSVKYKPLFLKQVTGYHEVPNYEVENGKSNYNYMSYIRGDGPSYNINSGVINYTRDILSITPDRMPEGIIADYLHNMVFNKVKDLSKIHKEKFLADNGQTFDIQYSGTAKVETKDDFEELLKFKQRLTSKIMAVANVLHSTSKSGPGTFVMLDKKYAEMVTMLTTEPQVPFVKLKDLYQDSLGELEVLVSPLLGDTVIVGRKEGYNATIFNPNEAGKKLFKPGLYFFCAEQGIGDWKLNDKGTDIESVIIKYKLVEIGDEGDVKPYHSYMQFDIKKDGK